MVVCNHYEFEFGFDLDASGEHTEFYHTFAQGMTDTCRNLLPSTKTLAL